MPSDKQRLLQDFSNWVGTLTEAEYVHILLDQSVVQFRVSGGGDKRYLGVSSVQNVTLWTRKALRGTGDLYDRTAKSKSFEPVLVREKFKVVANRRSGINDFNMYLGTDLDMLKLSVNIPNPAIDRLYADLTDISRRDWKIDPEWTFQFVTTGVPGKKRAGLRTPPVGNFLYPDPAMEPLDHLCAALPQMMSFRNFSKYGGMRTSEYRQFRGLTPSSLSERIEFVQFGHWDLVLPKFLEHSPQWKRDSCVESDDSFVRSVLCSAGNPWPAQCPPMSTTITSVKYKLSQTLEWLPTYRLDREGTIGFAGSDRKTIVISSSSNQNSLFFGLRKGIAYKCIQIRSYVYDVASIVTPSIKYGFTGFTITLTRPIEALLHPRGNHAISLLASRPEWEVSQVLKWLKVFNLAEWNTVGFSGTDNKTIVVAPSSQKHSLFMGLKASMNDCLPYEWLALGDYVYGITSIATPDLAVFNGFTITLAQAITVNDGTQNTTSLGRGAVLAADASI